jgi:hypothetical protein
MELIRNKRYLGLVFFGLFEILLGVAQHLKIIPSSGAGTPGIPSIVAGLFILAIGLYLSRKPDIEAMPDERTRKRDMKVFTGAFAIVFIYVISLMLIDVLWATRIINLGDFFLFLPRPSDITQIFPRYMSILFVALIAWVALTVYYNKKSDLE